MSFANTAFVLRPSEHRPSAPPASAAILPLPSRSGRTPDDADEPGGEPSAAAVAAALARVVASPTFRQSARHRAFLRYVVEATVAGNEQGLKEVVIALDVFGRTIDGYDPRRDSIVRVEARRLRMKLARYYAREGQGDPVEIRCVAGSYVPRFAIHDPARAAATLDPLFLVLPFATMAAGPAGALALGLADRMIDRLAGAGCRRVVAAGEIGPGDRSSTVDALRRRHGVDYVVDGCIVETAQRLRCTVHLSRTRDRLRIWTAVFDFGTERLDPFAVQDEVAAALRDAVVAERRGG